MCGGYLGCGKTDYRVWGGCLEDVERLAKDVGWLSVGCSEAVSRVWEDA